MCVTASRTTTLARSPIIPPIPPFNPDIFLPPHIRDFDLRCPEATYCSGVLHSNVSLIFCVCLEDFLAKAVWTGVCHLSSTTPNLGSSWIRPPFAGCRCKPEACSHNVHIALLSSVLHTRGTWQPLVQIRRDWSSNLGAIKPPRHLSFEKKGTRKPFSRPPWIRRLRTPFRHVLELARRWQIG